MKYLKHAYEALAKTLENTLKPLQTNAKSR
jgi:hypothetical protein